MLFNTRFRMVFLNRIPYSFFKILSKKIPTKIPNPETFVDILQNYKFSKIFGEIIKFNFILISYSKTKSLSIPLEPSPGFEPGTYCLQNSCSAAELRWHIYFLSTCCAFFLIPCKRLSILLSTFKIITFNQERSLCRKICFSI